MKGIIVTRDLKKAACESLGLDILENRIIDAEFVLKPGSIATIKVEFVMSKEFLKKLSNTVRGE